MNILFIYNNDMSLSTGGGIVTKRNHNFCQQIGNTDSIRVCRKEYFNYINKEIIKKILNKIVTIGQALLLRAGGLTKQQEKQIISQIKEKNYDVVFIDTSLYGRIIPKIKKHNCKIVTFFHNCERDFFYDNIKYSGFHYFLLYHSAVYNEKRSVKYSDSILFITEFDKKRISVLYKGNVKNQTILPVSIDNKNIQVKKSLKGENNTILFVGSSFYANIEGITWFLNTIMDSLDYKLLICGRGLSSSLDKKLLNRFKNKVTLYDGYENISELYNQSDYVIAPIFSGSGMKVKVAEALMHGCPVIGTNNAFEGYSLNEEFMFLCNDKESFINVFNKHPIVDSEKVIAFFNNNYSTDVIFLRFCNIMNI